MVRSGSTAWILPKNVKLPPGLTLRGRRDDGVVAEALVIEDRGDGDLLRVAFDDGQTETGACADVPRATWLAAVLLDDPWEKRLGRSSER